MISTSRKFLAAFASAALLLGVRAPQVAHAQTLHDFNATTLASYLSARFSSAVPPSVQERVLAGAGFSATDLSLITATNSSVNSPGPDKTTTGGAPAQQISQDTLACPSTDTGCELDTQVEPDIAVNPTNALNLVGVFQQGRFPNGGSVDPGWAASFDGGQTWPVTGNAPGLTVGVTGGTASLAGGPPWARASDPVVAFDVSHKNTLFHTIAVTDQGCLDFCISAVEVNISTNGGKSFGKPIVIEQDFSNPNSGPQIFNDKNWIVADNNPASRFFGREYSVWDQIFCTDPTCAVQSQNVVLRFSDDGGKTWSNLITAENEQPNAAHAAIGVQPVVMPNGDLVVVYADVQAGAFTFFGSYKAIRSSNGGLTWTSPVIITPTAPFAEESAGIRAPNLPSAAVSGGTIFMAAQDSRFSGGTSNDILLTSSSDEGTTWSAPIDATPAELQLDHFTPAIAAVGNRVNLTYRTRVAGTTAKTDPFVDAVYRSVSNGVTIKGPTSLFTTMTNLTVAAFTTLAGQQLKFLGDYAGIAASSSLASPIWGQAQNFANAQPNSTNTHERMFSAGIALP